jgi:hypothetical protein
LPFQLPVPDQVAVFPDTARPVTVVPLNLSPRTCTVIFPRKPVVPPDLATRPNRVLLRPSSSQPPPVTFSFSAGGGGVVAVTVIERVAVAVPPSSSVTVTVIVGVPAAA